MVVEVLSVWWISWSVCLWFLLLLLLLDIALLRLLTTLFLLRVYGLDLLLHLSHVWVRGVLRISAIRSAHIQLYQERLRVFLLQQHYKVPSRSFLWMKHSEAPSTMSGQDMPSSSSVLAFSDMYRWCPGFPMTEPMVLLINVHYNASVFASTQAYTPATSNGACTQLLTLPLREARLSSGLFYHLAMYVIVLREVLLVCSPG